MKTTRRAANREKRGWLSRERALALVLIAVTCLAFFLCYILTKPFFPALAWALALAVAANPLHSFLSRHVPPRVAAALSVLIIAVILVAPTLLVGHQLVRQAMAAVERIQSDLEQDRWREALEGNGWTGPIFGWLDRNVNLGDELQKTARTVVGYISPFATGSMWVLLQLLVMFFALFFFFYDGAWAVDELRSLMPLSNQETDRVFRRVADTIYATIFGTLLVAMVQGALGGLMFWWVGLPAAFLWGVIMALLALIPYLGAFVVWLPAAGWLALSGEWGKAAILAAWGTIVVGLIDNLLYPFLVGKRLRLHTLPTFIAIVGGLAAFGASGLILGPVVLSVTVALIEVWRRRTSHGQVAEEGVKAN